MIVDQLLTNKCTCTTVDFEDTTADALDIPIISLTNLDSTTNIIGELQCPEVICDMLIAENMNATSLQVQTLDATTINAENIQADILSSNEFESSDLSCTTLNTVNFSCNEVISKYYESKDFQTLDLEVVQNITEDYPPIRVASTFKSGRLDTIAEYKVINNTPSLFSDFQLATNDAGSNTLFIYGDVINSTTSLPRIIGYNTFLGAFDNGTSFGGKIAYLSLSTDGSGRVLRYERDGKLTLYAQPNTIVWQSPNLVSDIRDKTAIEPISDNCTRKVLNCKGYYYNYVGSSVLQTGLLAQEVNAEFPEVILTPKKVREPNMSVQYEKMIPALLEALKEIAVRAESLE